MYTVIVLNKHSSDLFKDYRFLFKPFVDEGKIAFCEWNESGTDLKSSVPDLYKIIKGKRSWRVLIVNTDSLKNYEGTVAPDEQNPFDFPSIFDENGIPHESQSAFVRLVHMIGGFEKSPVKEFEKGYEYYDEELESKKRVRLSELTDKENERIKGAYSDSLVPIYIEKAIAPEISEGYRRLHERYDFYDGRPTDILLVSSRHHISDNDRAMVAASWKEQLELESSSFWERNKYPNNCRFLFHDICNKENSMYNREVTDFWLSVLTLAINDISASYLQAYRIYKLDVDVDGEQLSRTLNYHLNRLEAANNFIREQLIAKTELSFDEDEEILRGQEIKVVLEGYGSENLIINTKKVGLSSDCPMNELEFWNKNVKEKIHNLSGFMKAPRRALDKSARQLKLYSEAYLGDMYSLDKFQLEDLHEEMDELEWRIATADTRNFVDTRQTKKRLESIGRQVRRYLACRMNRLTVILAGAVALLIYLAGYIPYIIDSASLGSEQLGSSLLLSLAAVLVVAVGGLITLMLLRRRAIRKMSEFNGEMRGTVNKLFSSADSFSRYFSDICTYMKGQSIIKGISLRENSSLTANALLKRHRQALITSINRDMDWMNSYMLERSPDLASNVASFFNAQKPPVENSLYYLEVNLQESDILINGVGAKVTAPYRFISKLILEREEIYDEEGDLCR